MLVIFFTIVILYVIYVFAFYLWIGCLPKSKAQFILKYEANKILSKGNFPKNVYLAIFRNPSLVDNKIYFDVVKMFVMSQDSETRDMVKLIKKINQKELYCYTIPNYSSNQEIRTMYADQSVADAIGAPELCQK